MAESTTQTAGAEARVNEQALVAARGEAVKLERERIVEIEHRATRFKSVLGEGLHSQSHLRRQDTRPVQCRSIRGTEYAQRPADHWRRGAADSAANSA